MAQTTTTTTTTTTTKATTAVAPVSVSAQTAFDAVRIEADLWCSLQCGAGDTHLLAAHFDVHEQSAWQLAEWLCDKPPAVVFDAVCKQRWRRLQAVSCATSSATDGALSCSASRLPSPTTRTTTTTTTTKTVANTPQQTPSGDKAPWRGDVPVAVAVVDVATQEAAAATETLPSMLEATEEAMRATQVTKNDGSSVVEKMNERATSDAASDAASDAWTAKSRTEYMFATCYNEYLRAPRAVDVRFHAQFTARFVEIVDGLSMSRWFDTTRQRVEQLFRGRLNALHAQAARSVHATTPRKMAALNAVHLLLASIDRALLADVYADMIYALTLFSGGAHGAPPTACEVYLTLFCIGAYLAKWHTLVHFQADTCNALPFQRRRVPLENETNAWMPRIRAWAHRQWRSDATPLCDKAERDRRAHAMHFTNVVEFPRAHTDGGDKETNERAAILHLWLNEVRFVEDVCYDHIYVIVIVDLATNDAEEFFAVARPYRMRVCSASISNAMQTTRTQ